MQNYALLLIFCHIVISIFTFYFSIKVKGRRFFITALYGICFTYSAGVGIFFLLHTSEEVRKGPMSTALLNMSIYFLALLILQHIGWSRISKSKPWLHQVYLSAITGLPLFAYTFSVEISESIAALSSTICLLCLIRYCEKKRDFITMFFLAISISGTIYTKPTSALICVITLIIVLISTLIKEHSLKTTLPSEFLLTLPIYAISFIRAPHCDMMHTAELMTPEVTEQMSIVILAYEILWCMPVLFIIPIIRKMAGQLSQFIVAGWMAICITFIYQMTRGVEMSFVIIHFGVFIAMHYIPFVGIFGLATAFVSEGLIAENGFDPDTEITTISGDISSFGRRLLYNNLVYMVILGFAFMLFFGNFPFYLLQAY